MSPEILAILGMTATILVAVWSMNRSLRTDLHRFEDKVDARFEAFEKKVDARFDVVHTDIHGLREDMHVLNARVSGLEGLMQGLKEAIVARAAA